MALYSTNTISNSSTWQVHTLESAGVLLLVRSVIQNNILRYGARLMATNYCAREILARHLRIKSCHKSRPNAIHIFFPTSINTRFNFHISFLWSKISLCFQIIICSVTHYLPLFLMLLLWGLNFKSAVVKHSY